MAPKPVDKERAARKEKIAEDKTFGMKNKNKSKNVQKYIKSIHMNAKGESSRQEQQEKKEKKDSEAAAKKTAVLNSLFNLQTDKKGKAYDPIAKKKAKELEEEAIAAGKKVNAAIKKSIIEGIANTIRLTNPKAGIRMSELGGHPIIAALKEKYADTFKLLSLLLFIKANDQVFWVDDPESSNPMIRCQADVDAETAPDERSIEDIIEEKRRELVGPGTPITEETFKAWKIQRDSELLSQVESAKAEKLKKGKAHMSGRDLFTYDASLFVDDEDAVCADAYDEREDRLDSDREDDEEDDDEDEADAEAVDEAAGSKEASGDVAINKNLFLQEADDLDDLDDLDDD